MDRIKYLAILIFLTVIMVSGCDNSVSITGAGGTQKTTPPPDTLYFGIYQDYGLCDTQCVGESIILINDKALSDECYSSTYTTGDRRYWDGYRWLDYSGSFLIYNTSNGSVFSVITGNNAYQLQGAGIIELSLDFNTNYLFIKNE